MAAVPVECAPEALRAPPLQASSPPTGRTARWASGSNPSLSHHKQPAPHLLPASQKSFDRILGRTTGAFSRELRLARRAPACAPQGSAVRPRGSGHGGPAPVAPADRSPAWRGRCVGDLGRGTRERAGHRGRARSWDHDLRVVAGHGSGVKQTPPRQCPHTPPGASPPPAQVPSTVCLPGHCLLCHRQDSGGTGTRCRPPRPAPCPPPRGT